MKKTPCLMTYYDVMMMKTMMTVMILMPKVMKTITITLMAQPLRISEPQARKVIGDSGQEAKAGQLSCC